VKWQVVEPTVTAGAGVATTVRTLPALALFAALLRTAPPNTPPASNPAKSAGAMKKAFADVEASAAIPKPAPAAVKVDTDLLIMNTPPFRIASRVA
jgi:hypothetical protein